MVTGYAPNGVEIVGTLETLLACAEIIGFIKNNEGQWEPNYVGGVEVFWEEQQTVERDGKEIYLDREGNEWTLDQIEFRDA